MKINHGSIHLDIEKVQPPSRSCPASTHHFCKGDNELGFTIFEGIRFIQERGTSERWIVYLAMFSSCFGWMIPRGHIL